MGRAILRFLVERLLNASGKGGIPDSIHADFTTPEYTSLAQIAGYKWETVRGLGYSFGYNRNETAEHMLSVAQLVHMLADIVSKNGNLLLNVGPMADGTIPPLQRERLESLGRWLAVNGEAIFGTRPWRTAEGETGDGLPVRFTQKNGGLYAILLGTPSGAEVRFPGLRFGPGTRAALLGLPAPLTVDAAASSVRFSGPIPASPAHVVMISPLPEID
jgi:alpha-L-fucosidase